MVRLDRQQNGGTSVVFDPNDGIDDIMGDNQTINGNVQFTGTVSYNNPIQINTLSLSGTNSLNKLNVKRQNGITIFNVDTTNSVVDIDAANLNTKDAYIDGPLTVTGTIDLSGYSGDQILALDFSQRLTTFNYSPASLTSSLVYRDASGNFSAATITAANISTSRVSNASEANLSVNHNAGVGQYGAQVQVNDGDVRIYSSNIAGGGTMLERYIFDSANFRPSGVLQGLGTTDNRWGSLFCGSITGGAATLAASLNNSSPLLTLQNTHGVSTGTNLSMIRFINHNNQKDIFLNSQGEFRITGDFMPIVTESASLGRNNIHWNNLYIRKIHGVDWGTIAAPSINFNANSNTGLCNPGGTNVTIVANGQEICAFDDINGVGVSKNLIPKANNTYNLGLDGARWNETYTNKILVGNGTVSAPSISFTSDINTGIYSSTTDRVDVSAGGVNTFGVTSTQAIINGTLNLNGKTFTDRINAIQLNSNLRLRNGGSAPSTKQGVILSEYGSNHFSIFNDNNFLGFNYNSTVTEEPVVDGGTQILNISSAGSLRGVNGSLSAPTYSFATSPDTGFFLASSNDIRVSLDGALVWRFTASNVICNNNLIPGSNNAYDLGNSGGNGRWRDIYATNGTINTSDRNLKEDIEDCDLGLNFIDQLRAVSFKFIDGTSGRKHYGLIAQEVEDVLEDNEISTTDFAALIKSPKQDENEEVIPDEYNYALRYTEFIAPMIKAIQELKAQVETLQSQVNDLLSL